MKQSYACVRCGNVNTFARYVLTRWEQATADRCVNCGAVHSILRGDVDVISRPMMPIDFPHGVVSPWQLWKYKPLQVGKYECRFHNIEPQYLVLWWNGRNFQVSGDDARAVDCRELMGWRGTWA